MVGAVLNGSSSHQTCWNTWLSYTRALKKKLSRCQGMNCHRLTRGPKTHFFAPVATIPKDDNGQPGPLDPRPITVTSLLYASWASTRFRDLREWIARWVDESVIGGREGKQVQEAIWPLILELESAAESDFPVSAADFDASKFFDHMEWDSTFGIIRELGMPSVILNPLANHVFRLQRFFKQVQSCGPLWRASNGLIQGCSLTSAAARLGKICSSLDP